MVVNLYSFGDPKAGKTTLAAALAYCFGAQYPDRQSSNPVAPGMMSGTQLVSFSSPNSDFTLLDAAAFSLSSALGSQQMNAAVGVISLTDGPMEATQAGFKAAAASGIGKVILFFNKTDMVDDIELRELIELETRELANQQGLSGDSLTAVFGSATEALASSGLSADEKANPIFALAAALAGAL